MTHVDATAKARVTASDPADMLVVGASFAGVHLAPKHALCATLRRVREVKNPVLRRQLAGPSAPHFFGQVAALETELRLVNVTYLSHFCVWAL